MHPMLDMLEMPKVADDTRIYYDRYNVPIIDPPVIPETGVNTLIVLLLH